MAIPRNNDELGSSPLYELIWPEAVGVDTDLTRRNGLPCRRIEVLTPGTLVVVRPDGEEVTLPALEGPHAFDIQAAAIVAAGSSATDLLVYW